jgi:hypothetical protein
MRSESYGGQAKQMTKPTKRMTRVKREKRLNGEALILDKTDLYMYS